jgi:hypothetical protein
MGVRRQVGEKWKPDPAKLRREREQADLSSLLRAWNDATQAVRAEFMVRVGLRQVEPASPPEAPG